MSEIEITLNELLDQWRRVPEKNRRVVVAAVRLAASRASPHGSQDTSYSTAADILVVGATPRFRNAEVEARLTQALQAPPDTLDEELLSVAESLVAHGCWCSAKAILLRLGF